MQASLHPADERIRAGSITRRLSSRGLGLRRVLLLGIGQHRPERDVGAFKFRSKADLPGAIGWGGRIRTCECRYQKPVPYHLATPQQAIRIAREARLIPVEPQVGRGDGVPGWNLL